MFLDLSGDLPNGIVMAFGSGFVFMALRFVISLLLAFVFRKSFLNLASALTGFLGLLDECTLSVEPWLLKMYMVWLVSDVELLVWG